MNSLVTVEGIEKRNFILRGQKVMLDSDLAELYRVATKAFNRAVKRNHERVPADCMFQLARQETEHLRHSRSQPVILKRGRNIKYLPYAFTEHGAIMAANALNSPRAVQMSVLVVRAFVRMRQVLATHKELATKLTELEPKVVARRAYPIALRSHSPSDESTGLAGLPDRIRDETKGTGKTKGRVTDELFVPPRPMTRMGRLCRWIEGAVEGLEHGDAEQRRARISFRCRLLGGHSAVRLGGQAGRPNSRGRHGRAGGVDSWRCRSHRQNLVVDPLAIS